MASLENRTGYFNVVFQFGGKKFTRSLNTDDAKEANRLLANLEQTIRDINSGRIILPPDADIPTFLLSDGKLTDSQVSRSDSTTVLRVSLRSLFESFFVALPDDSLEESTISQMKTHRNNLLRVLGNDIIVEQSDLTQEQQHELWECLYLRMNEIDELLQYVRENALHTFHYPMIVAAAHTGARRSELMRSQLADIRDDVLIIREKKRRRGQDSTRRVPMSTLLKETLRDWKREHPGGPHTFAIVDSSNRQRQGSARSLTRDEAHNQFRCVLKESRWSVIRGWHCLRHSFISNLASNGVDQRLIDEFVGHTTEEMRRRYRHLFPDVKQAAITSVFG